MAFDGRLGDERVGFRLQVGDLGFEGETQHLAAHLGVGRGQGTGLRGRRRVVGILAADPGQEPAALARDGRLGAHDRGGVDGRQTRKSRVGRRIDGQRGSAGGRVSGSPVYVAEHHGQTEPAGSVAALESSTMGGMLPRAHTVGIPHRSGVAGVPVSASAHAALGESRSSLRPRESPCSYSHSIVAGGFDEMSYTTRLTPGTSLTMRLLILPSTSYGSFAQSAVIPSSDVTARIATTFA